MREIKFRVWLGKRFWFFDITSGFNTENEDFICGAVDYGRLKEWAGIK